MKKDKPNLEGRMKNNSKKRGIAGVKFSKGMFHLVDINFDKKSIDYLVKKERRERVKNYKEVPYSLIISHKEPPYRVVGGLHPNIIVHREPEYRFYRRSV